MLVVHSPKKKSTERWKTHFLFIFFLFSVELGVNTTPLLFVIKTHNVGLLSSFRCLRDIRMHFFARIQRTEATVIYSISQREKRNEFASSKSQVKNAFVSASLYFTCRCWLVARHSVFLFFYSFCLSSRRPSLLSLFVAIVVATVVKMVNTISLDFIVNK